MQEETNGAQVQGQAPNQDDPTQTGTRAEDMIMAAFKKLMARTDEAFLMAEKKRTNEEYEELRVSIRWMTAMIAACLFLIFLAFCYIYDFSKTCAVHPVPYIAPKNEGPAGMTSSRILDGEEGYIVILSPGIHNKITKRLKQSPLQYKIK